ncbi:uncharacterized protein LOC115633366 [Scaptodrosophila lebanonensis]|uniref:Uncharacterized protein LOC115633366 n=1 Tax=Drosophila lebanonensis TaxID=7225 RepID=A0A6J2UEU5_DROLE|nr:uncharacterized protein LOC115633366 [Scaptodrosophila lebanonensis]
MSWSRSNLVAIIFTFSGLFVATQTTGSGHGHLTASGLRALELSALRSHKQLLQDELARLLMEPASLESPMLLEELQQRQRDIQMKIDRLETMQELGKSEQLSVNLTADFERLQHKLDDLKSQVEAMDMRLTSTTHPEDKGSAGQLVKQEHAAQPALPTSFLWTPLLSMPEFLPASVAAQPGSSGGAEESPSLIKRLLAILRPSSATNLRGHWTSSPAAVQSNPQADRVLSANELLPHLQLQRHYINEAIKRLELLSSTRHAKD